MGKQLQWKAWGGVKFEKQHDEEETRGEKKKYEEKRRDKKRTRNHILVRPETYHL